MVTVQDVSRWLLPDEFLRANDGGYEWDRDDSGDRAVLIDPETEDETYFTGLAVSWRHDDEKDLGSYQFYVEGIGAGQDVDFSFSRKGAIASIGNTDGTRYTFYDSGRLREVAFTCRGTWGARRSFDEECRVVDSASGAYGQDWGRYLDSVSRSYRSDVERQLVLPVDYVVSHGQDVSSLGGAEGWSGLGFARYADGAVAGYEFRVEGELVGQLVRWWADGTLRLVGSAMGGRDGTWYEYRESGRLERVSLWCRGKPVVARSWDEDGRVVDEQVAMTWDTWDAYLDWAQRR